MVNGFYAAQDEDSQSVVFKVSVAVGLALDQFHLGQPQNLWAQKKSQTFGLRFFLKNWRPHGDSNPGRKNENLVS